MPKLVTIGCSILIGIPLLCIFLLIYYFCYNIPSNNAILSRFQKRFNSEVAHPIGSKELEDFSLVGLFGNGNHCDFWVGQVRQSSLPQDTIKKHYSQFKIFAAAPEKLVSFSGEPKGEYYNDLTVVFLDDRKNEKLIDIDYLEATLLAAEINISQYRGRNTYLVYVFDGDYTPNGDPRCT